MARIRSIHPGVFTDEAFMEASAMARLLIFGLWCEAWDDGVFEWKPLTIKARLFPVDSVDVPSLLQELSSLNFIRKFDAGGKPYGAIRNFQKFQRPKKPNSSGLLPDSLCLFVGQFGTSSEPVPNQYGTSGEKVPQMEDGGWNREEEKEETTAAQPLAAREAAPLDDHGDLKLTLRHAAGLEEAEAPGLEDVSPILDLIAKGYSLSDRILPVLRRKRGAKAGSWAYFVPAIVEAEHKAGGFAAAKASTAVDTIFIDEGSEAWATVTRSRGKPPIKNYVNGRAGAFVRKAEIGSISVAA